MFNIELIFQLDIIPVSLTDLIDAVMRVVEGCIEMAGLACFKETVDSMFFFAITGAVNLIDSTTDSSSTSIIGGVGPGKVHNKHQRF